MRFLRVIFGNHELKPELSEKGGIMRDLITSGVKTAVQVGVAAVVAWAASAGIDLDSAVIEAALFSVSTGVVAFVLNWAGSKVPIVNTILSFGLAKSGPSY